MEQSFGYRAFNKFTKGIFKLSFKINIENNRLFDRNEPVIFVVNHNNWIDPFLVTSFINNKNMTNILAESTDLIGTRVASKLSERTGNTIVPVERDNTQSRTTSLRKMIELVTVKKNSLIVFPEGRYSKEECKMFPFYQGAFAVSKKYNIPIIPVTVIGNFELYLRKPITIRVGEKMYADGLSKEDFTLKVYDYMNENMPDYPGNGPRIKIGKFITGLVIKNRSDLDFDNEHTIRHKDYKDVFKSDE